MRRALARRCRVADLPEVRPAIDAGKLSDFAHLALWYAAAELRGGGYARIFRETLAKARGTAKDREVRQWIAQGLVELHALGIVELARNGTGDMEPVSIDASNIVAGGILQGDWN